MESLKKIANGNSLVVSVPKKNNNTLGGFVGKHKGKLAIAGLGALGLGIAASNSAKPETADEPELGKKAVTLIELGVGAGVGGASTSAGYAAGHGLSSTEKIKKEK